MKKITLYVDHDDKSTDFLVVKKWLEKWNGHVRISSYSTGGWEHIWNLEAPDEAISEVPVDWLCDSEWVRSE